MSGKKTIAKLVVALGANSAQLMSEFEKTKKKGQGWSRDMKSIAKFSAASFVAVGVAAGGAAVGVYALMNANAGAIDQLGKTSDKLGLTTEALQLLRYQGELTGVSINTTDMALQRMTRRVAEAAQGTGEAKGALRELRLDAEQLAAMSPDQQFYAIAEAMKQVSNQGDRVRLSMKLFDSEGVALVNTLISNLDAAEQKFASMGATITREQAAIVESYNDTKTNLEYIFGAFSQKMTIYLAGPFDEVLKYIEEITLEAGGMDSVAQSTATMIVQIFASIVEVSGHALGAINDIKIAFKELMLLHAEYKSWQVALIGGVGFDVNTEIFDRKLSLEQEIAELKKYDKELDQTVQRLLELPKRMHDAIGNTIALPGQSANQPAPMAPTVGAASDTEYQKLLSQYDKSAGIQLKYKQQIDDINSANITAAQKEQLLTKALQERNKALRALSASQREFNQIGSSGESLSKRVLNQHSDAISFQFRGYAQAFQRSQYSGEGDPSYYIGKMAEVLKGIASAGQIGTYDYEAMVQYLEQAKNDQNSAALITSQGSLTEAVTLLHDTLTKLNDTLLNGGGPAGQAKALGSVTWNVINSDGKTLSGMIWGDPDFLRRLQAFNNQNTRNQTRAAVR